MTRVYQSTDPTQVMYSDKSFKIMKKVFLFLNLFIVYCKQMKFWIRYNKKGSLHNLTQLYFLVIEMTKKKEKGDQGGSKKVIS